MLEAFQMRECITNLLEMFEDDILNDDEKDVSHAIAAAGRVRLTMG